MIRFAISEFSDALRNGRLRTLIAVGTVSIAMFIFSGFFLVSENIARGMQRFRSAARVEVILEPTADHIGIAGKILAIEGVAGAQHFSRQEALEYFTEALGQDLARGITDALGTNPFPAFIEVSLGESVVSPAEVADRIRGLSGVAEVIYGQKTAARWTEVAAVIENTSYGIGLLMSIFTVLIVVNNVRLSALSREHDIYVMRLVGADEKFVLAPFVLEGAFVGLAGSLVGSGTLYAFWKILSPQIEYLRIVFVPPTVLASVVVLGIAVGALGGFLAVRENTGAIADVQ